MIAGNNVLTALVTQVETNTNGNRMKHVINTFVYISVIWFFTMVGELAAAEKPPTYEDGYKNVNGVDLYYKIMGRGDPFIMLHGGPGMYHDELVPFFENFSKNHKLIFFDQRGNGKSKLEIVNDSTLSSEIIVDDIEGLRAALDLEKVSIIGHSWGGLMGMYYAAKYPENVDLLIAVSAAPVTLDLLFASYENHVSRFEPDDWQYIENLWSSEAYKAGDPDVHNEAMRLSEGGTFYDKSFVDAYMEAAAFNEQTAKNSIAVEDVARSMKMNVNGKDRIVDIAAPTLLIYGRNDFIVPEAAELAHQLIPNSSLQWIDKSGHYPYVEKSEEFFEILNEFINTAEKN